MTSRRSRFTRVLVLAAIGSVALPACDDDGDGGGADAGATTREMVTLSTAEEVPTPAGTTTATGSFSYELADATGVMAYTLTVANLTGPAAAAHIHQAPPGMAGPIVIPLTTPASGTSMGTVTLTAEQIANLKAGAYYVNVHTAMNAPGEVRAQLDGR